MLRHSDVGERYPGVRFSSEDVRRIVRRGGEGTNLKAVLSLVETLQPEAVVGVALDLCQGTFNSSPPTLKPSWELHQTNCTLRPRTR